MSNFAVPNIARPVAVVGSGTLGQRSALMLASAGGEVRLYDPNPEQAEAGRLYVERELGKAVPERLDLRTRIFGDIDRLAAADAVLASNSSSYPSSQLISEVLRPERVVNTHYYKPTEQAAVENMSCGRTHDAVIALLIEQLSAGGLAPFHVIAESVGFIFNRIWAAVKREALAVVAVGAPTPEDVEEKRYAAPRPGSLPILASCSGPTSTGAPRREIWTRLLRRLPLPHHRLHSGRAHRRTRRWITGLILAEGPASRPRAVKPDHRAACA